MIYAIFPIGGQGNRFKESEFQEPKPFIELFGKFQLEWSILSCKKNYSEAEIVIGCRSELVEICEEFVHDITERTNIEISVVDVGKETKGAAHTVAMVLGWVHSTNGDFEFIVLDNDVAVKIPNLINFKNCSASVVTTTSKNPAHSFVICNDFHIVTTIAEKEIISSTGVVGNYYFKSKTKFLDYYQRIKAGSSEQYISDVLKVYLNENEIVTATRAELVVSYGTPDEVRTLTPESLAFLLI